MAGPRYAVQGCSVKIGASNETESATCGASMCVCAAKGKATARSATTSPMAGSLWLQPTKATCPAMARVAVASRTLPLRQEARPASSSRSTNLRHQDLSRASEPETLRRAGRRRRSQPQQQQQHSQRLGKLAWDLPESVRSDFVALRACPRYAVPTSTRYACLAVHRSMSAICGARCQVPRHAVDRLP